jgi:predicted amidohydrolase YtcJ
MLIDDDRIAALDDAAETAAGDETRRIDLQGAFVMASWGDGHAHPLFGGLEAEGPNVRACASVDEIVAEVARYAAEHPIDPDDADSEWIFGASYDGSLAEAGLFDARWLDSAVADRPVVLRAWDYHTVWVNSEALRRAGINRDTPDPELGEIPHRDDGEPLGTLREWGAVDLVMMVAPIRPDEVRMRALQAAGRYYVQRGVTWVQDAWVEPGDVDTYVEAAARGILPIRFNLAHYADPRTFEAQLPQMIDARRRVEEAADPLLTAQTVKFFADGVVENETGALLEPYCSGLHDHGMHVWGDGDALANAVRAVDAAGFQIHIHAIGDAAVRQALGAIEGAIEANGPRDRRPVIAHAQLIAEDDLGRFSELGVIACMQPLWAQQDALMTVLTIPRLGEERADRQYQMHSLEQSGATLSFGSDWPVSSGDPRDGIAIAVSRQTTEGEPAGGWIPQERVPIDAALHSYSAQVARQAFADHADAPWGVIEPGASADLVILESDPRDAAPSDIPAIRVVATFLRGTARYES